MLTLNLGWELLGTIGKLVPCCCIEAMAEGIQVAMARLVEIMAIPVVSWLAEVVIGSFVVDPAWSVIFWSVAWFLNPSLLAYSPVSFSSA